jgi:translation initiation factor IF-2
VSEPNKSSKETLSLSSEPRRLELRKTEASGQVKQSFSHGRSKTVQVEVRRKRTLGRAETAEQPAPAPAPAAKPAEARQAPAAPTPPATPAAPPAEAKKEAKPEPAAAAAAPPAATAAPAQAEVRRESRPGRAEPRRERPTGDRGRRGLVLPTLSEAEKQNRAKALQGARQADEDARRQAEEEARRRAVEAARMAKEREEADRRRAEEEERKRVEEEARRKAEEEADRRLKPAEERARPITGESEEEDERPAPRRPSAGAVRPGAVPDRGRRETPAPKRTARRGEAPRRRGKLTVTQAMSDDDERMRSLASVKRERERQRRMRAEQLATDSGKIVREVVVPETITVQDLANRMAERGVDVIRKLMEIGVMATINQSIDADTAELVVAEFGHRVRRVSDADVEIGIEGEADTEEQLQDRPPVVTVMGHVDHGKTSLLDAIRQSDVVSGEAGGITQHIGAYQVTSPSGQKITFIDTPGHAAFTAMRARGAKVTDLVVLVVAADDGVMPQTIEAINHARAAEVPIIVAINKMDRPDANPERVKQELLQHEIVVESMGGEVQTVEVSALKKTGLEALEEAISLQAELLELKANPNRVAEGVIVEAKLDRGRGPVATVLVQRGTLRVGDVFVAGAEWGKVRALLDSNGNRIEEAGPSVPIEVVGANAAPEAGDPFIVVESEQRAREITEFRSNRERDKRHAAVARGSIEQMFSQIQAGEVKELPVVVKTDVQGSAEAIAAALTGMGTDEVAVRLLHIGVGGITESDITLAAASNAMVVGFNVRANAQARELAKRDHCDIRYYSVIYELVDDVKNMLSGMLAPEVRETVIGQAEILEVFNITKVGKVAGCKVTSGVVRRNTKVRLLRDDIVLHEGGLKTLKRFKDEVREVREGQECGIALENYTDIQAGDQLEVFEVEEVQRTL